MIPKNWDNITIDQYAALKKTESVKPKDELEEHDLRVQRACIITGLDLNEINSWPFKELLKVDDLMKTPLPTKIIKTFRLNGKLYRFRENPKKYSGGEYCAIMNACKDASVSRESELKSMHRLCYLICKPVNILGFKQKITEPEEIEKRIDDFKQLPLKIANPMALFFWALSETLTDAILVYSTDQMNMMNKDLQKETSYLEGTAT